MSILINKATLMVRGLSSEVADIYLSKLSEQAITDITAISNNIETDKIKGSGVEKQWGELETLLKTNTAAAGAAVNLYETKGTAGYERMLSSLAGNMALDKDFATRFVAEAQKSPGKTLSDYQAALETTGKNHPNALKNYMNGLTGRPLVPDTQTAGANKTATATTPHTQKPNAAPSTSAARKSPTAAPNAAATTPTSASPLDTFLAQNTVFAGLVNGNPGLKDKMAAAIKENPDLVDKFYDPGQMTAYMKILQDKSKKPEDIQTAFMGAFAPKTSGFGIGDMLGLGGKGMDGLKDMFKDVTQMLGLGDGKGGGFLDQLAGLGNSWKKGIAMMGNGEKFTIAIHKSFPNGITRPEDKAYFDGYAADMTAAYHHGNQKDKKAAESFFANLVNENPGNKQAVEDMKAGRAGFDHIDPVKGADGKTTFVVHAHGSLEGMMAKTQSRRAAEQEPARLMAEARAKAEAEEAIRRGQQSAGATENLRQEKVVTQNEPSLAPTGATATT